MEEIISIIISVIPALASVIATVAAILIENGIIKKFFSSSTNDVKAMKRDYQTIAEETMKLLKENETLKKQLYAYEQALTKIDQKLGDIIENGEEQKRLHETNSEENMAS